MVYNPFDKKIGETLLEADLSELINQNVSEGYYIEYKGETFPDNTKIGHSIASFANTYGGWYFIGIKTDEYNVANEIRGFDLTIYPDPISKVRDIIRTHIDPTPIFYAQVVNLAVAEKAVLVVYVPPEQNVPFISKNGKIYRRTHDCTEPVFETNRYEIDRLYDEGRQLLEKFENFCKDERTFTTGLGEPNVGWINVFLKPVAYEPIDKYEENELELIRRVLTQSQTKQEIYIPYEGIYMDGNLPFNSGYPRFGSFILKQTSLIYSAQNGLAVELFYDGRAKFHIPVPFFAFYDLADAKSIESPKVLDILNQLAAAEDGDADSLRFFDIGEVWSIVTTLSSFYLRWLGDDIKFQRFNLVLKFNNIWRGVPYFDDDIWADYVENFGLPVSISGELIFPDDLRRSSIGELSEKSTLGAVLFNKIGTGFGLTLETQTNAIVHLVEKRTGVAPRSEE